jgi:hypothetical protein
MFLHPREAPGDILLFEGPCLSDPTSEGVLMLVHAKKLSLTAILALLGSALVASPAQGDTSPVNCSGGGSFTVTTTFGSTFYGMDFSQGVRVEVSSSSSCTGMAPIPVNVNSIGPDAFSGSEGLTSVAYADGINLLYIGPKAFTGTKLSSVTIPGTVQKISVDAFLNSSLLTSVTFEGNAPEVAKEPPTTNFLAFSSAGSDPVGFISTLAGGFPDDPTWEGLTLSRATGMGGGGMGGGGMSGGMSGPVVETVPCTTGSETTGTYTIQDNVITSNSECAGSVTIPASVTSIGTYAFDNAISLGTVTFEAGSALESIGNGAFQNATSLALITIPKSVTSIGANAFGRAIALTTVTFEVDSALDSIGPGAFFEARSLESITIPNNVTLIKEGAFFNCNLLATVTFEGVAPTVRSSAFGNVAVGARAIVSPSFADSFGSGQTWNGLELSLLHSVVFDANGGSGTMAPQRAAPSTALKTSTFIRDGFDFNGWNTAFDGIGTDYAAGAIYGFISDETLYAKWTPIATSLTPAPYSGPIPTNHSDKTPAIGDEVTITGVRLDQVTSCTIDGVEVEISSQSATGLTIVIPEGLEPGLKDLVMVGTFGKITAQGAFTVEAGLAKSPVVAEKTNAGSFNGYVAVYAKGHKGKTLSWKIAGKWFKTTITSDFQVFQRKTEAVGLDVEVHLYIDGEKQTTKKVRTR